MGQQLDSITVQFQDITDESLSHSILGLQTEPRAVPFVIHQRISGRLMVVFYLHDNSGVSTLLACVYWNILIKSSYKSVIVKG